MDVKTQSKAAGIIHDIQNTLDNPDIKISFSLLKWIEELSRIIADEYCITNLPSSPEKSMNIFVCEENLIDRVKEIEDVLRIALHSNYGVWVKLEYCKETL